MNETEYTDSEGVCYVAEPPKPGEQVCAGCAHAPDSGKPTTRGCVSAPACVSLERDGGLNIIWVRREK